MATVNMRRVNFWLPPDFRPNPQHTSRKHHRANLRSKRVSLYNNGESTLKRSGESQPTTVVTRELEFSTHSKADGVEFQDTCNAE
jgi:hypothetical protein